MRALQSGQLDHVPRTFVEEVPPTIAAHAARISEDPRVVSYYASRK